MSEGDPKPRVRVEVIGDPSEIFKVQSWMAEITKDVGQSLTKALAEQIAGVNQRALEALAASLKPSIGIVNEQIAGVNQRALEAFAASLKPRVEVSRMVGEMFSARIAETMDALKPTFERLQQMWETALPPNWREFEKLDRVTEILAFMEETGWALAWVPRPSVIEDLLGAPDAATRSEALLGHEAEVLDDLDACLAEISDSDLTESVEAAGQAVASYRDGRDLAAQALATCLFTTLIHLNLQQETFGAARVEFSRHDPMNVSIGRFRLVAILRTAGRAIDEYRGRPGEPIPTMFNRHASTHRVGAIQYTRLNSLTSLMLVASLLRELDFWGAREQALAS